MNMIRSVFKIVGNLPGWRTKRQIIVIESDDWGSIRMPSAEVFHNLKANRIPVDQDPYCRFDGLESNSDLALLFEVLQSIKDSTGNFPVFTALSIVANPDFEKIRSAQYSEYFYEPFTETLKKYPCHNLVHDLLREGIENKLFVPQFHGREHLNVQRWLRDLQSSNVHTMFAFENGLWGIYSPLIKTDYQAAFDIEFPSDNDYLHSVLSEGMSLFEKLFGYRAEFFVPPNGPFNLSLESTLFEGGIKYLTLDKLQKEPLGNGKYSTHLRYLGKRNKFGQIYLSRNASFEPSQFPSKDCVDSCLHDIAFAFRMQKPAVISTHRLNYIGWLNKKNQDENLKQLRSLLKRIMREWPGVEFMTSTQLGNLIMTGNGNGR